MLLKTDIVDGCKKRIPENKQREAKQRSNHFEHKKSQMTTVFSNPEGIAEDLSWKNTNNWQLHTTMKHQHKTDEMATNHIKIGWNRHDDKDNYKYNSTEYQQQHSFLLTMQKVQFLNLTRDICTPGMLLKC